MSELLTMQDLANGHLDVKALGEAANGDENTIVTTRTGNTYPSAERAINIMFKNGGLPATPFATKALMTASALADGDYALVTDDTDNNGLYVKNNGQWVRSEYDPISIAGEYTNTKHNEAISSLTSYTDSEIGKIAEVGDFGELAAALTDANDNVLAYVKNDATVFANDFVTQEGSLNNLFGGGGGSGGGSGELIDTSLAQAFTDESGTVLWGLETDATVISPYPPIQGFGVDAIRSQLLSPNKLNAAGKYLDKTSSEHLAPVSMDIPVAFNEEFGRGHVRIPCIHKVDDNRLIVSYTQYAGVGQETVAQILFRYIDYNLEEGTYIVSDRRELIDVVTDGSLNPENPNLGSSAHYLDTKDGVLMIFHARLSNQTVIRTYKSTDKGESWKNIGDYIPTIEQADVQTKTFLMASSSVCRIPAGIYKDRIVITGYCSGYETPDGYSGYEQMCIYSDDEGATWTRGYHLNPSTEFGWSMRMTEASPVTDTDNNIIVIVRDDDTTTENRMYWAISKDGGKTLQKYNGAHTYARNCMTATLQFAPHNNDGVPKIMATQPHGTNRKGLMLRTSYNNGLSWASEYPVRDLDMITGYSQIKRIDQHTVAVAYEHGGFNAYSDVSVKLINMQEIYK